MKLFEKLDAIQLPVLHTQKRDAEKLFAHGVSLHKSVHQDVLVVRKKMMTCGFDFLQARAGFEHGDWQRQCDVYAQEISERSIRRYMQLADLSWRWVLYKNPTVKEIEEIKKLAVEMVMVSPKPIVELLRELGHVLKFGGYFEDDYQEKKKRKLLADGQVEFDFTAAASTLDMICNERMEFRFPDGMDRATALGDLKSKCLLAVKKIDQQLKTFTV